MSQNNKFVIEGGVVNQVREEVLCSIPLDDFLANLAKGMGTFSGMLPYNCLFITGAGKLNTFVVQLPPKQYPVKYSQRKSETPVIDYRISIPFVQMYFVILEATGTIKNVYMSCTKSLITKETEPVYVPPFLNIFDNGVGKVCNGQMSINMALPLNVRINQYMSEFFVFMFNNDLQPTIPKGLERDQYKFMEDWHKKSAVDPLFGISSKVEYAPMMIDGEHQTVVSRARWIQSIEERNN